MLEQLKSETRLTFLVINHPGKQTILGVQCIRTGRHRLSSLEECRTMLSVADVLGSRLLCELNLHCAANCAVRRHHLHTNTVGCCARRVCARLNTVPHCLY
jgi:hypothetical protein